MNLKSIQSLAADYALDCDRLIPYGRWFAKYDAGSAPLAPRPGAKLVLVTAMTPTKAGEGKTTTVIGLTDGLNRILGRGKAIAALRQPSMGPVFGMKGGATGGGRASILPSEEININFTGDIHALTAANSLISAVIDNSIFQGNVLNIDENRVVFPRAVDMNDRAIRQVRVAFDKHSEGHVERTVITAASELMAILCLAETKADLHAMVDNIICAYTKDGKAIRVSDLGIGGAVTRILNDAFMPNLVQTAEGSLALVHGGPFANIAHGCCSIRAIRTGLSLADYTVTEAGFGSDLGGEKFCDILCPRFSLVPDCIVVVGSVRSCKLQGGVDYADLGGYSPAAVARGAANLVHHLRLMSKYTKNVLCCINRFDGDAPEEIRAIEESVHAAGFPSALCSGFAEGAQGAEELARQVVDICGRRSDFQSLDDHDESILARIEGIARNVYGAEGVDLTPKAHEDIERIQDLLGEKARSFYICMAKTPLSLTDDPKIQGAPSNFRIRISQVKLSAGAGFIIPISGSVLLMPGLPKVPAAVGMKD